MRGGWGGEGAGEAKGRGGRGGEGGGKGMHGTTGGKRGKRGKGGAGGVDERQGDEGAGGGGGGGGGRDNGDGDGDGARGASGSEGDGGGRGGGPLDFHFDIGKPLRPIELQMMVMPPSGEVLPQRLASLLKSEELKDYFPEHFTLDVLRGEKFIYSDPILPELSVEDREVIKEAMYGVGLTAEEEARNGVLEDEHVVIGGGEE